MRDQVSQLVQKIFQHYYRELSFNFDYQFHPSKRDRVQINNFIAVIDQQYTLASIGEVFLKSYFEFQFQYWNGKVTRFGVNNVQLSWTIGQKAFDRWIQRDIQRSAYREKVFVQTNDIVEFKEEQKQDLSFFHAILSSEELEKKRYLNTELGFDWCLINTTLFKAQSPICFQCSFQNDCIEALQKNYPNVFNIRINLL